MKRIKLIELIKEIIQEAEVEKATIGDLEDVRASSPIERGFVPVAPPSEPAPPPI